jgi:2-amino-4-hydroxy-6-hydroxymethyldihydropteridine diphosphokinase
MNEIYILLGSNRGDRERYISNALELLEMKAGPILARSSLYETAPWGFDDPVPFLNQVVEIESDLTPLALLDKLLTIEVELGRIRPFDGCGCGTGADDMDRGEGGVPKAYTGRTIDLDILFYGQQLVFTDNLMVPHPRLHERKFTLVPMLEIAPGFIHPVMKKSITTLVGECSDQSKVLMATIRNS